VTRREAELMFEEKEERTVMPDKKVHVGWCIVDPKTVEKTVPTLNELGVVKISFLYCERSQKHFKIDLERLKRILTGECRTRFRGRTSAMRWRGRTDPHRL